MLYFFAVILSLGLYYFARKSFDHWKWKKVPYLEPKSFIFGHYYDVIVGKTTPGEYFRSVYEKLVCAKFVGLFVFWKPILLIRDPDIVKEVLRNADYFDRNPHMVNPKRPLTRHLFNLSGVEWKVMRNSLQPAFSPFKIKEAFELVERCSVKFVDIVCTEMEDKNFVDIVDLSERYCIDIMTSFIFGLQAETLENPKSIFRQMAIRQNKPNIFTAVIKEVCPQLINILNISSIDASVEEFFVSLVQESIKFRKESTQTIYQDFMTTMLKLKNGKPRNRKPEASGEHDDGTPNFHDIFKDMDVELMGAQCFIMFMAGFKPTSFLMNCLWLEITKDRLVQEKLQKEIDLVLSKYDNKVSGESLYEMTYLDQVISEVIRLHPVSPILFRTCKKDYPIPNTDFVIEKGTELVVPIYGIHHDQKYYSTPEKFNPEHFSRDSQAFRPSGAFVSFGEGPRQCIAMRLALMMVKLALIKVLHLYTINSSPKMSPTLRFSKYLKVMRFNNPILLHCIRRQSCSTARS